MNYNGQINYYNIIYKRKPDKIQDKRVKTNSFIYPYEYSIVVLVQNST